MQKLVPEKLHGGNFSVEYVRLGKTNLLISRVAFGAMRVGGAGEKDSSAVTSVIRKAYDSGINFFDVSGKTPESEKILGDAIYDIRRNITISTTTASKTTSEIQQDLERSLQALHTNCVDLYQFETEVFLPIPGGADKIYDTLMSFKEEGKIKNIGIVTTNPETAKKAIESNLYDTLQFPFSMVSSEATVELVKLCEEHDVGFIAMQPLGGGLLENIPLAFGFLSQYESVVPIWGIQTLEELEQILYFQQHPPVIDEQFNEEVDQIRNFFN